MTKAHDSRIKDARAKFKLGVEADQKQAEREKQALRMYALDQWPEPLLKAREAQNASGNIPATPARPCLVVDRLREPVAQVVNQERESDLAVELVPADDFGGLAQPPDPAEIELREGLIRRIQRESESASARTWAFTRAAICGRGYYAINTRYADGKTFDQEIYCRRILYGGTVVLDPAHEEPDGSDAEWGFIFTVMSWDAYKAEFPEASKKYGECSVSDWLDFDEADASGQPLGWYTHEGEVKYLKVAEYWYTVRSSETLYKLPDGSAVTKAEIPEGVEPVSDRELITKSIKWCKMDGCQVLDETDWPSPYVPIIKIVGNEIPPHDEQRHVDGMVNKSAIDSQRGLNYMVSRLVEEIGLSAVPPLMTPEGAVEGYEAWYNQANLRPFPYLPFKTTDLEGRPIPPPFRPDKSVAVAPIATAVQMFAESIQTSTGPTDPAMGKPSRYSETWRGTQALINQSQRGTSNYMDNFTRSVRYEGRIINSLLYPIYGNRPGRMARIVQGEGEAETVMIGQPFMMQDNGQGQEMPVPAPPGATGQTEGVREYKLTEQFKSNVAVKVTKGYDTRRQEEGAILGEMVTQQPQMMTVIGDLFFGSQDWPGAKEAQERFKVMLDPKVLAMLEQQKGGQNPIPPQALQQMQQMQAQLQQVTQAAQQMQQDLQAKISESQIKAQSEREIAQLKAQAEIELANIKAMAEIRIAELKAGTEIQKSREVEEAETQRERMKQIHEITAAGVDAELHPEPVQEQV